MPSDATLITLAAIGAIFGLALAYDGQFALIAIGALAGLIGGHGLGQLTGVEKILPTLVKTPLDPPVSP